MRKEYIKVSILILIFFLFYSFFGFYNLTEFGKINNSQDFNFHFNTIQNKDFSNYPPLYHFVLSLIPLTAFQFYLINLILICVIIPLLLFKITKKSLNVIGYFCLTSLPHILIFGATFPHALVLVFFLIYLIEKRLFPLLIILATLTHKSGLMLFIGITGIEVLLSLWDYKKIKFDSFFSVFYLLGERLDTFKNAITVLLNAVPLPLIYFSKKIIDNPLLLFLSITALITAITTDIRAISIIQISLLLSFQTTKKQEKLLIKLFAVYTIYYLINFGLTTIRIINA